MTVLMRDGADPTARKLRLWCESTDTIYKGYLLCPNWDYGTAATAEGGRAWRLEKPAVANMVNGVYVVVTPPAVAGVAGFVEVVKGERNCQVDVFTEESCTIGSTVLTVKPDSYVAGGLGEGIPIGLALQTVDRSSTNGLVRAIFTGVDVNKTPVHTAAGRMNSPAIWATCPWDEINRGQVDGFAYFNDFTGNYALANNQTVTRLGDGVVGATAATSPTISSEADEPYGSLKLFATTDNEDAIISILGGNNAGGQLVFETGKKVWFEARVKRGLITDSKAGCFVGFAEEGLCATTAVVEADGTMPDKDYIGFHQLEGDGDKFDIVYNTAGGGGAVDHLADAVTLVADTYVKLGMYCDGTSIYFYADGVLVGTALTLATTKVPDGEEMAFYMAIMNAHADDAQANIDWVRIAQQRA